MVKRLYKKWKSGRGRREEYVKGRKSLREFLKFKIKEKRKKKEEELRRKRKKEEQELRRLRKDFEIWKFINKKRNKRDWKENNIG